MAGTEENEFFRSIGRMEGQVIALAQAISDLKLKIDDVDKRLAHLDRVAQRWKGGFAVILTIGAAAGVLIDICIRWIMNR